MSGVKETVNKLKSVKGQSKYASLKAIAMVCHTSGVKHRKLSKSGIPSRLYTRVKQGKEIRKKRKDSMLSQPTLVDKVQNHWYENSREMPLHKRVKKQKPLFLLDQHIWHRTKHFDQHSRTLKLDTVCLSNSNHRMSEH